MPRADIVCPHCGEETRVNVAALPQNPVESKRMHSPCRECGREIIVDSLVDGTHDIRKKKSTIAKVALVAGVVGFLAAASAKDK